MLATDCTFRWTSLAQQALSSTAIAHFLKMVLPQVSSPYFRARFSTGVGLSGICKLMENDHGECKR
jgi:hypothetical protein